MAENSQEVQYRILQEAHETASQLSAESGSTVTIVQMPQTLKQEAPNSSSQSTVSSFSGKVRQASISTAGSIQPSQVVTQMTVIPSSSSQATIIESHEANQEFDLQPLINDGSMSTPPQQLVISQEGNETDGIHVVNQVQVEVDSAPEGMLCLVCSDRGD